MKRVVVAAIAVALLWWIFDPMKWWLPRHEGRRSRGTTTGWVMPQSIPVIPVAPRG